MDLENNPLVISTGYMGSGSSAMTDVLAEFESLHNPGGSFELVFLHCPNGVFDLEDKLLRGNNALRSDEALHSFREAMKALYDAPFWWPGNYKKNVSKRFMDITDEYVRSLVEFESDGLWYHQEKRGPLVFPKLAANKIVRTLSRGKIVPSKPLYYKGMTLSFPDPDAFFEKSRHYIEAVLSELAEPGKGLVLDQLLLPHNAWRMDDYFDGNAECFIVDRDPRDVFILNKYLWPKRYGAIGTPYPTDVQDFCTYYKKIRSSEIPATSEHVHRIHFEDLVYDYDSSMGTLCETLGLDERDQHRFAHFNPDESINNTQLFLQPAYHDEAAYIQNELEQFLYEFPYEFTADSNKAF